MRVTRLNHRITFQRLTTIQGEYGPEEGWENLNTVWADIKPITGKTFFSAMQINSEITHQVFIRYTKGISPSMRILYQGRLFEILYVMNYDEGNETIQMLCKELVK